MTRTLDIWWDGRLVGQLTQNQHGELGFAYASKWLNDEEALGVRSLAQSLGGEMTGSPIPLSPPTTLRADFQCARAA